MNLIPVSLQDLRALGDVEFGLHRKERHGRFGLFTSLDNASRELCGQLGIFVNDPTPLSNRFDHRRVEDVRRIHQLFESTDDSAHVIDCAAERLLLITKLKCLAVCRKMLK